MEKVFSLSRYFRFNLHRTKGYFPLPVKNQFSTMDAQPIKDIKFDSLKDKVLNGNVTLIDVREPNELKDDGKIPYSVNIPLGQIAEAFQLSKLEFHSKYGIEKPSESEGFVISCKSGRRATNAFNKLFPLGYTNIVVYSGSYQDWLKNGGPIEKH